jgi:ectoine hydroxylase-related dioxygenase (phytanoyl-CoA dioxygenase family)
MRTAPLAEDRLTRPEALGFHERGYVGPITLCAPHEMARIRERIEREVLPTPGPDPAQPLHCRHLDRQVIHELVTHPAIVIRAVSLLGADLMCWSSNCWIKEPGAGEIPWHQDFRCWPLEPALNLTAWIAIDTVDEENGCVRLIPGSHRRLLPEVRDPGGGFATRADPAGIDEDEAVPMALAPGQCFLFNERLLHQSNPNRSGRRRFGFTVRLTATWVHVRQDHPQQTFPGHSNLLVHGADRAGINRIHRHAPAR